MYTEKDNKKVSILGTEYNIKFVPEEELDELDADGVCDTSIKCIRVKVFKPSKYDMADIGAYQRKVLRHEIVHAFLAESGLWECSGGTNSWAISEAMVDWIARQHSKLHAAFEKAGAL